MDPVSPSPAARVAATTAARAQGATSADPAAATGGIGADGSRFTEELRAATDGKGRRGVPGRVLEAERHEAVDGHRYARITAGVREGLYLNQSGNAREGRTFALVERGGRTFHVYGSGPDRTIVEVGRKAAEPVAAPTPAAGTDAPGAATGGVGAGPARTAQASPSSRA